MLGLLSLIVWALTITVSIKYVFFVTARRQQGRRRHAVADVAGALDASPSAPAGSLALGVIGAALFFGDAIITPAISVLSAVEGLEVVAAER